MMIDPIITGVTPYDLMNELEDMNIESRLLWKPMHLQPVFSHCPAYLNGTSERLFSQGLCLPSGSNLSHDDLERIIDILGRSLRKAHPVQKKYTSILEPYKALVNLRAVL